MRVLQLLSLPNRYITPSGLSIAALRRKFCSDGHVLGTVASAVSRTSKRVLVRSSESHVEAVKNALEYNHREPCVSWSSNADLGRKFCSDGHMLGTVASAVSRTSKRVLVRTPESQVEALKSALK